MSSAAITNWAGHHRYRARSVERPSSLDELRSIVASADRLRVLGTRHSFNDLGDGDRLISLDALPGRHEVDVDACTVTVDGATTYADLAPRLFADGLALANLASLPGLTVAGAVATGTHGSGRSKPNLAAAVRAIEVIAGDGSGPILLERSAPDGPAIGVHLGMIGVVTAVTLEVEGARPVRQSVWRDVPWSALDPDPDAVLGAADSVSLFTDYGDRIAQVWVKEQQRMDGRWSDEGAGDVDRWGGHLAVGPTHPVDLDASACTSQGGVAGPWHERWPHFRAGAVPSVGEEIQSEYFVPWEYLQPAIEALRTRASELAPALLISEIRSVAADDGWLSPHAGQDSAAFHFTWRPDPASVARAVDVVETALSPWSPRPHWGKWFHDPVVDPASWPHADRFFALADRLDPSHRFRTPRLDGLAARFGQ